MKLAAAASFSCRATVARLPSRATRCITPPSSASRASANRSPRRSHRSASASRSSSPVAPAPSFVTAVRRWPTRYPRYVGTPARSFEKMLDPANGLAVGDPARMATAIIDSVDRQPAPLRLVLGSQALESTVSTLRKRIADFAAQTGRGRLHRLPTRRLDHQRQGIRHEARATGQSRGLPNRAGRHGHVPRLHRRRIRRRRIDPHHPPCPRPRRHPHRHRRDLRSVRQRRTRRPGHQGPS